MGSGKLEVVRCLCKAGVDENITMAGGWTPLLIAAHQGHTAIAEFLCKKLADVNKGMEIGWTPLFVAALAGHEEVGEYLVSAKANVNVALKIAEEEGNQTLIKNLNHWTDGRLHTT